MARGSVKTRHVKSGTTVCILPTPPYRARKGHGLIHKTRRCGVMMEEGRVGPEAGWDVYDVRLSTGKEVSAYGFDIRIRRSKRRK